MVNIKLDVNAVIILIMIRSSFPLKWKQTKYFGHIMRKAVNNTIKLKTKNKKIINSSKINTGKGFHSTAIRTIPNDYSLNLCSLCLESSKTCVTSLLVTAICAKPVFKSCISIEWIYILPLNAL